MTILKTVQKQTTHRKWDLRHMIQYNSGEKCLINQLTSYKLTIKNKLQMEKKECAKVFFAKKLQ